MTTVDTAGKTCEHAIKHQTAASSAETATPTRANQRSFAFRKARMLKPNAAGLADSIRLGPSQASGWRQQYLIASTPPTRGKAAASTASLPDGLRWSVQMPMTTPAIVVAKLVRFPTSVPSEKVQTEHVSSKTATRRRARKRP